MAKQLGGRALNQGLLVWLITKEAEGCSEWVWEDSVLLIRPARPPSFPSRLWTPIQTFTSYKGLNLYSAICGFHNSRGSPTWQGGSLCVPGRPAEEAGSSCHLIPAHGISCLCRDNFFPLPNRDSKSSLSLAAASPESHGAG